MATELEQLARNVVLNALREESWPFEPNLLSLDVLLPMSDEWAFARDCWWEDKTDNDGGEYSSTLKTIDLEPARHVVVVASGTFYDVDNVGPLDARVAARLKAWLAALKRANNAKV